MTAYVPAANITAVIVAFHRPAALRQLVAELGGWCPIVIVNVENDGCVAEVGRDHGARVVSLLGNPGFAAAANAGVAQVSTGFVAVMNDDLVVSPADLAVLVEDLADADVAAPLVVGADGCPDAWSFALPTPGRLFLEWALLPDEPVRLLRRLPVEKWRRPTRPERVEAVTGALLVTRTALLRQRPLPEEYFLYWEESAWFHALARWGKVVVLDPTVRVTHLGGRADVRPEKSRLMARNAVRCVQRTQGRSAAAAAWPVVVLWQLRLWVTAWLRRDRQLSAARRAGVAAAVLAYRELW